MKPLGIDLRRLSADAPSAPTTPDCPGARLRLTRSDYDRLSDGGERFASKRQDIPVDGYGDARVLCTNHVARIPSTASGATQHYGLCHSCSGLEADNRMTLRERARVKGER